MAARPSPRCIVIAGPNGAGKDHFRLRVSTRGLVHLRRLKRWKSAGYRIEMVFLSLPSPQLAFSRIAARVKQGGHDVRRVDVLRRFVRGWQNYLTAYRPLADAWAVYDCVGDLPILVQKSA